MKQKIHKIKQRMFEVQFEGEKHVRYPLEPSMKIAIIKQVMDNISKGGTGNILYVKTDKGAVYTDIKINVTYKKKVA